MKYKISLWRIVLFLLAVNLFAAPGLINYQGRLTDAAGQPIATPVNVAFTFWDAESGGTQLGGGFADMDTVSPDADGIYSTLIGDDPGNLVPESIFEGDSVWLNVNVGGEDLAPRLRITSFGHAVRASKADTATTATTAAHATNATNAANADLLDSKHAADFATASHNHNLQDLPGAVTDAQIPNDITIDYAAAAGTATTATTANTATTASGLSGTFGSPGDRINLGTNVWLQAGANGRLFFSVNGQQLALSVGGWTNPSGLSDNISPDGQSAAVPQVAMSNSGSAMIIWLQSDGSNYQTFRSEYRGGVWINPGGLSDNISPNGQSTFNTQQVAMDANGNAIIVWRQSDGSKTQIFKSEYRGGAWTHPAGLTDNISPDGQNADYPQVAMDNNGNAIIVWEQSDGSRIQIFKSEYRGGSWTHPSGLADNISPDGQMANYPQVAMDSRGNAIITWNQVDGSVSQIYKSEYRSGAWTHPSGLADNISPDGQNAYIPQVAMNNNGNAIIVWEQIDGVSLQIFMSEYRNGAWTHPAGLADNISPDVQGANNPQVAMDNNDNIVIAWSESNGTYNQIFKSEYRGGVWTHPANLSDNISPDGPYVGLPQVAMDDNGNAMIVWVQYDASMEGHVFKSEYRAGAWTHPAGLSDNISPSGQEAYDPQPAMDNNGNAIITWRQGNGTHQQVFKSEYRFRF